MLSRFSKLPGISSLLSSSTHYPRQVLDRAVADIKRYGKSASANSNETLQCLTKILSLMKKYAESIHVQRVACHALSNLAMQVVIARWIVQKGGFALIRKAIRRFESDHKLCWLGSSALWNIARPPANRGIIGKEGVELMLHVLSLHHTREKVTNTTIGALSNLSLDAALKDVIAQEQNVDLILRVLAAYAAKGSLSVMTSGAGLLANLAVSDDHASVLVERRCLPILLRLLSWRTPQDSATATATASETADDLDTALNHTLARNVCAALNNMVTAHAFLEAFLSARGVETIFDFLQHNANEVYTNLLENCLINVEVDASARTTSLHLCSLHGRLEILQHLLRARPGTDLNAKDDKQRTCLDYSISMNHTAVTHFLAKCGATDFTSSADSSNKKQSKKVKVVGGVTEAAVFALDSGVAVLRAVRKANHSAIYASVPELSADLCKLIVSCMSNVDMLTGMDQYVMSS